MSRAQTEVPFQWLFVLIAGGAFLVIFFIVLRSCTQSGDAKNDGVGVTYAASRITAAAWQPNTNTTMTVREATVSCPAGGAITLSSGDATASVERVPAFLPPTLSGKLVVVTKEISISGDAPISFGSVLYGIDENTYYVVDSTLQARFERVLGKQSNVIYKDSIDFDSVVVPSSATDVVLVTPDGAPPAKIPVVSGAATMRWVGILPTNVLKFSVHKVSWSPIETDKFSTDLFAVGAAVSGKKDVYVCAKGQFVQRARTIVKIADTRLGTRTTPQSLLFYPDISEQCKQMMESAKLKLPASSATDDNFLKTLLVDNDIRNLQQALFRAGCPVIA